MTSLLLTFLLGTSLINGNNGPVFGSPITAPSFNPPPGDVLMYVDAVNGLDTNPGTLALPKQTLMAGVNALPTAWAGKCQVLLAVGTYPVASPSWAHFGTPIGPNSEPAVIQGTLVDSGLGTRTISAVTVGASSYVIAVQDNTLSLTLNRYDGYILRFTTGAATGLSRTIIGNTTAGSFSMQAGDGGASKRPAVGDHFVIETQASIITPTSILFIGSTGVKWWGGIVLSNLQVTGSLYSEPGTDLFLFGVKMDLAGYKSFNPGVGTRVNIGSALNIGAMTDLIGNLGLNGDGLWVTSSNASQPGTVNFTYANTVQGFVAARTTNVFVSGTSNATLYNLSINRAQLALASYGYVALLNSNGTSGTLDGTGFTGDCVSISDGGRLKVSTSLAINNCTGNAITVGGSSSAYLAGVTGSGSSGVGVEVQNLSRVQELAGTSVTGTGGDCKAGASTSTHAVILGGVPLIDVSAGTDAL